MGENEIGEQVIGGAVTVHRALGPGLLESAYEACLDCELKKRGLSVTRQVLLPIDYDGQRIDAGYRTGLLVDEKVVVELKSVAKIADVHVAQTLTYLRLGGFRLGYVLNFNSTRMTDGIRRLVNEP